MLAAFEVDTTEWEVIRPRIGFSEVTLRGPDGEPETRVNYNGQATLQRIPGFDAVGLLRENLLADMAAHAPVYPPVSYTISGEYMAEVSLSDIHFGLYAWKEEAGADWDTEIAVRYAEAAIDNLLAKVTPYPLQQITTVIGSDWFHTDRMVDGKGGVTTKGTFQDQDTRRARVFRLGAQSAVASIDRMREHAPVVVKMVGGNHDAETVVSLGEVLKAWYRSDPHVEIDNSAAPRKYTRFGTNLTGYVHGHAEKPTDLPLIMAQECPEDWAASKWRDWKTGHIHTKRAKVFTPVQDIGGVWVYTLPTLVPSDAWHALKGYMHQRAAEAFVYHKEDGLACAPVVSAKAIERQLGTL